MENNVIEKKKTNKGIIIVLVLIILGLAGYITYDKVLKDKYFSKKENEKIVKVDDKEKNNQEQKNVKDSYSLYLTNRANSLKKELSKNDTISIDGVISNTEVDDISYVVDLDNNLDLSITINKNIGDSGIINKKIDSDVIDIFTTTVGQGGLINLYYLKTDGSLYEVNLDNIAMEEKVEIKKENKKNIVSIKQALFSDGLSGAMGPLFIDIDGNVVED